MNHNYGPWGQSANEFEERFWSRNADGSYTVAVYAPTASVHKGSSPVSFSTDWPRNVVPDFHYNDAHVGVSLSNEEMLADRLQLYAKALGKCQPLYTATMSHSQIVHSNNQALARSHKMHSYVRRMSSFLDETGEFDEHIPSGQSVRNLAEAGFFSTKQLVGPGAPCLICWACGFEIKTMQMDPFDEHYKQDGGCGFNNTKQKRKAEEQLIQRNRLPLPSHLTAHLQSSSANLSLNVRRQVLEYRDFLHDQHKESRKKEEDIKHPKVSHGEMKQEKRAEVADEEDIKMEESEGGKNRGVKIKQEKGDTPLLWEMEEGEIGDDGIEPLSL